MIFILGPCVIESEDHALFMALGIKRVCDGLGIEFTFKASFDKANRLSAGSFRGPGLEEGLRILAEVKAKTGLRVTSDIHEPHQAAAAAEVLDIIQIPALLCRQTDLVEAAARTGKPLNIKKGQFMAPEDMAFIAKKAWLAGSREIWITERGTTFGYNNLVVDMRSIAIMRRIGFPVIMDASHAVQRPAAGEGCSAADPEHIPALAQAAVAAGADGVFLEVHDCPADARSDGQNQFSINKLEALLARLLKVKAACA